MYRDKAERRERDSQKKWSERKEKKNVKERYISERRKRERGQKLNREERKRVTKIKSESQAERRRHFKSKHGQGERHIVQNKQISSI